MISELLCICAVDKSSLSTIVSVPFIILPELLAFILLSLDASEKIKTDPEVIRRIGNDFSGGLRNVDLENIARIVANVWSEQRLRTQSFIPGLIALASCTSVLATSGHYKIFTYFLSITLLLVSVDLWKVAHITDQNQQRVRQLHLWLSGTYIMICAVTKILIVMIT
jgi:hypothetical protein